jgi:hypothetical protein
MGENSEVNEFRSALELKAEADAMQKEVKYSNPELVDKYMVTIPIALTKKELVEAEREWVEIQVEKQKILAWAKAKLLTKEDYQDIRGKLFIKKSGVRRLMSAFNISITEVKILNIIERDWESAPSDYVAQIGSKKEIIVITQARAVKKITLSKNGITVDMIGQEMVATAACSSRELYEKRQPYKFHNFTAQSETRSKSRAALDMLSGDVSLEEVTFDGQE